MTMKYEKFWDYLIINEDGNIQGIDDNAPEKEKESYKKFLSLQNEAKKRNIKL